MIPKSRRCENCGSKTAMQRKTGEKGGRPIWLRTRGGYLCFNCYVKARKLAKQFDEAEKIQLSPLLSKVYAKMTEVS